MEPYPLIEIDGETPYERGLQYGKQAMDDVKAGKSSFALEQVVLAVVITSGMVSYLIDSYKYNSNMGHAIFYGMTVLPQIEERHLHGEVVSYGVLCMLMMDKQMDLLDRIYKFMKSIGLPTKLADMEVTLDEMGPALDSAVTKYDIECSPYKITKELMYQAVFVHVFTGAYLIPSMLVSRGINFYFLLIVSLAIVLINRFVFDRRKTAKAVRA